MADESTNARALNGAGRFQQIAEGVLTRVLGSTRYLIPGISANDYLGPGQPQVPVAPPDFQPRRIDYPISYNYTYMPRAYELVPYAQMRGLAESWDLLRLVIETRKDQMVRLPWRFRVKGDPDENTKKKSRKTNKQDDPRIEALNEFFSCPDGENSFSTWMRLILEDLFVIDAVSILPRWKLSGGIYGFDVIDGGTIHRSIDSEGRTPRPPYVAYQQIIKGLPTVDLAAPCPQLKIDQLVYAPRNKRSNKIYGYPPVEQIIMTINLAIRRQLFQLEYYTDGSVPDLIASMPENVSTDQIQQFETWWNSVLSGQTAERRKAKFVEHGTEITLLKDKELFDSMDDWLARVVCFAFSIPPTALVKMTNRASAQQMSEDSRAEGLEPLTIYFADLMNFLVQTYIGYKDIEFVFGSATREKPLETAQVNAIYLDRGVILPDEVRVDLGYEPLPDEVRAAMDAAEAVGTPKLPLKAPAEGGGAAGTSAPTPTRSTQTGTSRSRGTTGAGARDNKDRRAVDHKKPRITARDKGEGDGSSHGQIGTV